MGKNWIRLRKLSHSVSEGDILESHFTDKGYFGDSDHACPFLKNSNNDKMQKIKI